MNKNNNSQITTSDMNVIEFNNLRYRWKGRQQDIINIDTLRVQKKEHTFLRGESGSGKTTLLNLLAGILVPTTGEICMLGKNTHDMRAAQRDRFRSDHIGIIFQQFNLLPYLSIIDNVLLPCYFSKRRREKANDIRKTATYLLDHLKLDKSMQQRPVTELSVGQQQRVAVARALIGKPEIIIADEPTSALDTNTRNDFLSLLFDEAETQGSTILFVSHDPYIAEHFPRVIELDEVNQQ